MAVRNRPERADTLKSLSVKRLQRGRFQPRKSIDGAALARLAKSVQAAGVIQPLFVRKVSTGTFEILAGERRWHAAKMAGLREVPTVIRNVSDATALAISLVENLHREDLNPIDQAIAIQRLVYDYSMTHAEVADLIGRSRATVSNLLRLLELPESVQAMVAEGELDMGHARALLSLPREERQPMAAAVAIEQLSVREVERRVSRRRPAVECPAGAPCPAASPSPAASAGAGCAQDDRWTAPAAAGVSGLPAEAVRSAGRLADAIRRDLGKAGSLERRRDGRWHLDIGFDNLGELADAIAVVGRLLAREQQS